MGIKEKRAKIREEFRQEILNEARALFVKDGYEKFSLRRLAEQIGYTPTTIYRYFKDKDELLYAVCEDVAEYFFAHLNRVKALYPNPIDALREGMLCHLALGFDNPAHFRVFFFTKPDVYGTHEDFLEKKSVARECYLAFRELVQSCIEAGQLRRMDPVLLTMIFGGAIHGIIAKRIFSTGFPMVDSRILAETLVDGLLRGFRKEVSS